MFRFIKHHPRLFISILVGILVFLFLPDSLALHTITRLIVAWNAMAWLYLILASLMIKSTSHAQMKLRAKKQNEGKYVVLTMVVIAAIVSLGAIVLELGIVKEISGLCDLIIIVGSQNSSNSNRLKELALRKGVEAYMIDHEDALQSSWLLNKKNIGISAGASAPEISVKNIVNKIESLTKAHIRELPGVEENVIFRLPKI